MRESLKRFGTILLAIIGVSIITVIVIGIIIFGVILKLILGVVVLMAFAFLIIVGYLEQRKEKNALEDQANQDNKTKQEKQDY